MMVEKVLVVLAGFGYEKERLLERILSRVVINHIDGSVERC